MPEEKKFFSRYPLISLILAFVLGLSFLLLGERAFFDLNRLFNPEVKRVESVAKFYQYYTPVSSAKQAKERIKPEFSCDSANLARVCLVYPQKQKSRYFYFKVLLHGALAVPLFFGGLIIYYWFAFRRQRLGSAGKLVMFSYLGASLWLFLHFLSELGKYVLGRWPTLGIYLILLFLIIFLGGVLFVFQKRQTPSRE